MDEQAKATHNPVNTQLTDCQKVNLPMPREFNGKKYYGAADVAKIIGVSKVAVWKWQNDLYFGCPPFAADERAHDGRYLYDVERVMQLKAVYRPNWTQGGYDAHEAAQMSAPTATKAATPARQPIQTLENVPDELLTLPRWFKVAENKRPLTKAWSNPGNQKTAAEIDALAGFDVVGHDAGDDYLFLDFDHVLDEDGNFVSDSAAQWFSRIHDGLGRNTFAELSASGRGIHILAVPTAGKFPKVSSGKNGRIFFADDKSAFVEIFFGGGGRYCFVTGNCYHCSPKAPVAHGEAVDRVFEDILKNIADQNKKPAKPADGDNAHKPADEKRKVTNEAAIEDSHEYDLFRAEKMLDAINPADLSREDWLRCGMIFKNLGADSATWERWSSSDSSTAKDGSPRYKQGECEKLWATFNGDGLTIGSLHDLARSHGYDEKSARREWYQLHPELRPSRAKRAKEQLKRELDDAVVWLESLTPETIAADDVKSLEGVRNVALAETFGFAAQVERFFATLKAAIANAKNRLKEAADELSAPLSADERDNCAALADGINLTSLRRRIEREVTSITKEQERWRNEEDARRRREFAAKKREEERAQHAQNIDRLEQLQSSPPSLERDSDIVAILNDLLEWRCDRYGEKIAVKMTQANADMIFRNDPVLDGLFGFDEFQQADVFLRSAPWNRRAKRGDEWRDSDDQQLRVYLRRFYGDFSGEQLIRDNFTAYSRERGFHEVKNYFRNLPAWDGVKRAETFFIDWLKVPDSPFAREVTLKWLTAAVARIFYPGCRFQWCIVLRGNQKIGKGFLLERLGGKWYLPISDSVTDSAHILDSLKLCWIGEFKEMAGMRKADADAIKAFIELPADTRRFAYERRARTVPRHCVFAITCNDEQFLSDLTGNRRFLILNSPLPKFGYVKEVRGERLTDDIVAQIWAEVFAHCKEIFADGFDARKLLLTAETERRGEEIAETFLRDDGLPGQIADFVDRKILPRVIWELLSREERRQFFVEQKFVIDEADLHARFKLSAKKISAARQEQFNAAITPSDFMRRDDVRDKKTGTIRTACIFYGTEYRQHVTAVEVATECFALSDKRGYQPRISEILARLVGWHVGKRIQKDPAYGDQKTVYWRDDQTQDVDQDVDDGQHEADNDFIGTPITDDELPFDENDLPFDN